MTLLQLSPLAFALGLASLAGLLFALQRLRVRHREVVVPTLLFWREASEEAPARVLTERFRHPLAYLLTLSIAALLWFAFAGPVSTPRAEARRYDLLIDASAAMQAEGRLAAAVDLAREQAARLPAARRRVVWCGSGPRTVLAAGEPAGLLDQRLRDAVAEPCPATLDAVLASLAHASAPRTVLIYGDSALAREAPETDSIDLLRPELDAPTRGANRGLVAFGLEPARSGRSDAVDLRVALSDAAAEVAVELDGVPRVALAESVEQGARQLLFRDLPARGGRVTAELVGSDAVAFDDRAARRLPVLTPLRVALEPGLPAAFEAAVAADPGLVTATGAADVTVRASSDYRTDLPGFELTARDAATPISIREPSANESAASAAETESRLSTLVGELGLDRLDATALATALGVPLAVELDSGATRRLGLWAELFDLETTDLVHSRAFPVLVSRGLRWAAGRTPPPIELAAGRPLSAPLPLLDARGVEIAGIGAPAVPVVAGEARAADGTSHPIALATALGVDLGADSTDALEHPIGSWLAWATLAALLLLLFEWWAVRTGRMP